MSRFSRIMAAKKKKKKEKFVFLIDNVTQNFLEREVKQNTKRKVKAYCIYVINKIIDGRLQIWNFSSRVYLDTKRL